MKKGTSSRIRSRTRSLIRSSVVALHRAGNLSRNFAVSPKRVQSTHTALNTSSPRPMIKTHPDYMAFSAQDRRIDRYPVERYTEFLDYIQSRYAGQFWLAHPSEVAQYWTGLRPPGPTTQPPSPQPPPSAPLAAAPTPKAGSPTTRLPPPSSPTPNPSPVRQNCRKSGPILAVLRCNPSAKRRTPLLLRPQIVLA